MMKASGMSAALNWCDVPLLPGALELARAGSVSGGTARNMEAIKDVVNFEDGVSDIEFTILADAQTSGGMLISVSADKSDSLVKSLVGNETLYSSVIGKVFEGDPGIITIWQ
jgi:selenide,water dikinase